MRTGFLLVWVLLTLPFTGHAQTTSKDRTNYSLLWEISGNGLERPSYLFGTMHVLDKRAFDFSDSVIAKILTCEGFALEFSPDSLSQLLGAMMLPGNKDIVSKDLKDTLSEEEYNILNSRLYKETGLSLEQLKAKTPKQIAGLISQSSALKNDKETFLDAYLYRIALGEDKKMFGLEDQRTYTRKNDYEEGIEELKEIIYEEQIQLSLQELAEIYHSGDIEKMYALTEKHSSPEARAELALRNHHMADRIELLSPQYTMFYAVGAAHLAGPEGLIALLRDKGYTLTLVPVSFTGKAAAYRPKPIRKEWKNYTFEKDGYTIALPGQPVEYKRDTAEAFHLQLYPDLASGLYFASMSFAIPEMENEQMLELFSEAMTKEMFKSETGKKVNRKKSFLYQGHPAVELDMYEDAMYGRLRFIITKSHLYMLLVATYKKGAYNTPETERFFESLQMLEVKPREPEILEWKFYPSVAGAYTVECPLVLEPYVKAIETEQGDYTGCFQTAESSDGNTAYWVGYYLTPPGLSVLDDSLFFNSWIQNLVDETPPEKAELHTALSDGYPTATFYKRIPGKRFTVRFKAYQRGSRMYLAFVVALEEQVNNESADRFLESFRLQPYASSEWETYEDGNGLSWLVPNEVQVETDTLYDAELPYTTEYSSQDSCTGSSYTVLIDHYSPYYYCEEEEFFDLIKKNSIGEQDSLLSEKRFQRQGLRGMELVTRSTSTKNIRRIAFYPYGQSLIEQSVLAPEEELNDPKVDRFFASVAFEEKKPSVTLFQSKADRLLYDLTSDDSLTRSEAVAMIDYYRFQPSERLLLYRALHERYTDDTSAEERTRSMLLSRLPELKDQHTVDFVESLYPELQSFPYLQLSALQALLACKDRAALTLFVHLLKDSIPNTAEIPYGFFGPLKDSLAYNAAAYADVFFLHGQEAFRGSLYDLGDDLLDSSALAQSFFQPYLEDVIQYARQDLRNAEDYNTPYINTFYALELLQHFAEQPEVLAFLKETSHLAIDPLAFSAVRKLVETQQPVDADVLEHFASLDRYRLNLYELLEDQHQLALFPKKWYKQESFARADMYNFFGNYEDEYYYEDLKLITSKVITYEGIPSRFYLFKALSEGEWYVGVSGPFAVDKQQVYSTGDLTNSYYETLESKSINEHFKELVTSY